MICRLCEKEIIQDGAMPYFCDICKPNLEKCPVCDGNKEYASYCCDQCWNDTKEKRRNISDSNLPEFFRLEDKARKRESTTSWTITPVFTSTSTSFIEGGSSTNG